MKLYGCIDDTIFVGFCLFLFAAKKRKCTVYKLKIKGIDEDFVLFWYLILRIRRVSRSKKTHILRLRHILTIRDAFVPWIWRNVLCVVIVAVDAAVRAMETTEITPTIEIEISMITETESLSDTSTRPLNLTGMPIPILTIEIPMITESDTSTRPLVFTGMPILTMETTEIVLAAVADARTALQIPAADSQPPCLRAVYLEN